MKLETSKAIFMNRKINGIQYLICGSKFHDSVEIEIETHIAHLDLPNGTAHFLEHLTIGDIIFDLKQKNKSVGLNGHASDNKLINISTSFSYRSDKFVGYTTPKHVVDECFRFVDQYLSTVLYRSRIDSTQEELDRERGVILAEYKQQVVPAVDCALSVAPLVSYILLDKYKVGQTDIPFVINTKANTIGSVKDITENITLEHINKGKKRLFNKDNTFVRLHVPQTMIPNIDSVSDEEIERFMKEHVPNTYMFLRDMQYVDGSRHDDVNLLNLARDTKDYIISNIKSYYCEEESIDDVMKYEEINTPLMLENEKFIVISLEDPTKDTYRDDDYSMASPSLKQFYIDYLIGIYCAIRSEFGEIYSPIPISSLNSSSRFISNKRLNNPAVGIGISITQFSEEKVHELKKFISEYNYDYINRLNIEELKDTLEHQLTDVSNGMDSIIINSLEKHISLFNDIELNDIKTHELFDSFHEFVSRDINEIKEEILDTLKRLHVTLFVNK